MCSTKQIHFESTWLWINGILFILFYFNFSFKNQTQFIIRLGGLTLAWCCLLPLFSCFLCFLTLSCPSTPLTRSVFLCLWLSMCSGTWVNLPLAAGVQEFRSAVGRFLYLNSLRGQVGRVQVYENQWNEVQWNIVYNWNECITVLY